MAAVSVTRALGLPVTLDEGSTDSNMAMSMSIPAITIDGGGRGTGAHALDEAFDHDELVAGDAARAADRAGARAAVGRLGAPPSREPKASGLQPALFFNSRNRASSTPRCRRIARSQYSVHATKAMCGMARVHNSTRMGPGKITAR